MNFTDKHTKSLEEVHESVNTLNKTTLWKRILSFFGPAYLVSVGYMDPGNWATDIAGGSKYGYALIWVLVMSNIMAIILQSLCARLGIVYKRDLAQVNRETYPPVINFCLYVLAELAIAACDLAEIIGMAIGLNLLFGLPLIYGVCITIFDTFLLLYLQKLGMRKMEAFIIALIAIIFASFAIELFLVKPSILEIAKGIKPVLPDSDALYIAIGIIGATVMPHNLYLHSALVQTRKIGDDDESKRKAIKWNFIDSTIALNLALFVNAAILILAGSVFYNNGMTSIASIEEAHQLLAPLVGSALAPILFAVALIAAGQSSTITGTLAGQIVMEGYLQIRINPWVRRLVTRAVAVVPAFLTILIAGEDKMTDLLIFSQVVLSIQLAFAIIPLIFAVSNKRMMGTFVIKPWLIVLSVLITVVILYLNIDMVIHEAIDLIDASNSLWIKLLIYLGLFILALLLMITIFYPFFLKHKQTKKAQIHHKQLAFLNVEIMPYKRIALALDFGTKDNVIISNALKYISADTELLLIHVVESAGAKVLGEYVADAETNEDLAQLHIYQQQLQQKGITTNVVLGYRNRTKEIVSICKKQQVDLLILGAHGHKGLFDFLYGQTIDSVRHQLEIPILIVK
ncbi:MAG: Nramp family divalent metal transporter [Bacteroidetes bacterium]|nr:Nramp family divalent metal transporter [Bacteroidota bacterium]